MHLIVFLLAGERSLEAQFFVSEQARSQWRELTDYLELSEGQFLELVKFSSLPLNVDMTKEYRLKAEIGAETARSPLRPAELGRLHAAWETHRRQVREAERTRNAEAQALLNGTQLINLKALDELARRKRALQLSKLSGLSPIDCNLPEAASDARCHSPYIPLVGSIPGSFGLVVSGQSWNPFESYYPGLYAYLGLSATQGEQILENERRFVSPPELRRMITVVEEIQHELEREVLDPLELGRRYAEVEAIRRKLSDDARAQVAANLAILSEAQRIKLNALAEVVRLEFTAAQARRISILGSRCRALSGGFDDEEFPFESHRITTYLGDCPDVMSLGELPE